MARLELEPARTISAPAGSGEPSYRPWVEVSALVVVEVPAWEVSDRTWLHWAVPALAGRVSAGDARPFEPGRRSATRGEPAPARRAAALTLTEADAAELARNLLAAHVPTLHRQPTLALVSWLGEGREEFRRRCLRTFAPALPGAMSGLSAAAALAALGSAIESRRLAPDELTILRVRCRIGWYPVPLEPLPAQGETMATGPVRSAAP